MNSDENTLHSVDM